MKLPNKIFILVLVVIICVSLLPVSAFADYTYYDPDYNASFIVPDGYSRDELNEDREYIKVKFVSDDSMSILMYGSTDVWATMTASDKEGYTREDFNMDIITDDDIENLVGELDGIEINKEYLGYYQFYTVNTTSSYSIGGYEIDFDVYMAMYFDNGIAYMFQFYDFTGERFQDLLDITTSAVLPTTIKKSIIETSEPTEMLDKYANDEKESNSTSAYIIAGAIIVLAICIVWAVSKKNKPSNNVPVETPQNYPIIEKTEVYFCPECGNRISEGSNFCKYCGRKIK